MVICYPPAGVFLLHMGRIVYYPCRICKMKCLYVCRPPAGVLLLSTPIGYTVVSREVLIVLIPDGTAEYELIVKKSRFVCRAGFIDSTDAAREEVKRLKTVFSDATHVVHACITGPSGDLFSVSDDREPPGTAGRPVLEILKGSGITDILVTVTRWFGGTKLGTGGLVKAYGDAARGALDRLPVRKLEKRTGFTVRLPYRCYEQTLRLLEEYGGILVSNEFTVDVNLEGTIGEEAKDAWAAAVGDLTGGGADVKWKD